MEQQTPVWKILTVTGAIPYFLLVLYGISGALFGSPFEPLYPSGGSISFFYNVLSVHNLFWPVFLISFILLNIGVWDWFLEAYRRDPHPGRILLFLLSIGPMVCTIGAGIIIGSHTGIMLDIRMLRGVQAMLPWVIYTFTKSWYFHLAPLVCFPLCVSNRKYQCASTEKQTS